MTYTACECSGLGSLSPECDDVTGVCVCRANVTGDKCDTCRSQHYGHFTGRTSASQARFPFKRSRLRCVRCVNENRKKRNRLRWQAANHGCHCFD